MSQYSSSRYGMTELLFPIKGHRNLILLVFFSLKAIAGHRRGESQMWFYEFLNSNAICMNEITLNVLKVTFSYKLWNSCEEYTDQDSSSVIFPVSAHVSGPHRGRVVIPDERQHYYQRLHWSHTQGLERRDRRMYPHPLWAYLNSALHAPTWEKVWGNLINTPV